MLERNENLLFNKACPRKIIRTAAAARFRHFISTLIDVQRYTRINLIASAGTGTFMHHFDISWHQ